jgi:hypothetical protein
MTHHYLYALAWRMTSIIGCAQKLRVEKHMSDAKNDDVYVAKFLELLCRWVGKDDPVTRREACLAICRSEERYCRILQELASRFLIDIVSIPDMRTKKEILYPVLHYGTLKLVNASSVKVV